MILKGGNWLGPNICVARPVPVSYTHLDVYKRQARNSEYLKETFTNGEDYIDEDAVYNTWIEYVGSEDKADVIHKAVYQSGSALDYYVENFGFEFEGLGLLGSCLLYTSRCV